MTSDIKNKPSLSEQHQIDDVDLRQLVEIIVRRWPLVIGGGSIGFILSVFSLIITKPVYQGEFQIVLSQDNSHSSASSFLSQNASLARIAGLRNIGGNESIATEVQILTSPSVLQPVFNSVKDRKPENVAKAMRFQKWAKSSITAKEEKGTSVLNVSYRDTDKDLVLDTIRMISQTYQSYSNRRRSRELNNVISYLNDQVATAKPQAEQSNRRALEYGYSNGLGLLDGLPLAGNVSGANFSAGASSSAASFNAVRGKLESARTAAQQNVKALEVQIKEVRKVISGSLYFASQLSSLTDKSSTFDELTRLESRLADLRSRLRENDPTVQKLVRKRTALISFINQQTLALLKGELDLAKAKLKALNRPKGVVSRHRELTQKALRDEATLVGLQNELKRFELEQARATNPWELISTPTLLDNAVSPRRGQTLAVGLLAGVLLGSGVSFFVDRRSGRIFRSEELTRDMPGTLLKRLHCFGDESPVETWHAPIQLLCDGPLAGATSVALIPVGSIAPAYLDAFASCLREALGASRNLVVSGDLLVTRGCGTQLLLAAQGSAKREQLLHLREQLALQGSPVAGWVLLETSIET